MGRSFLRADAVEILEASPDRVVPPCRHAGPGRCGGCDWQHVSLPAQRRLKSALVSEQLRRVAGIEQDVEVEALEGSSDGLGWRTRVRFAVDGSGRIGLRKHRSHDIEPVGRCPLATEAVSLVGVGATRWNGAQHVEVTASPEGGDPVVSVETGRGGLIGRPAVDAGLVVDGRTLRKPDRIRVEVLGRTFEVSAGVFWQVHPGAATTLTRVVLEGLAPVAGERVADLYAGAGLFTVPLARLVGPHGRVVAVERHARSCADAARNATGLHQVEIVRAAVDVECVEQRLGHPGPGRARPGSSGCRPAGDASAGRTRPVAEEDRLRGLRSGVVRPRPEGHARCTLVSPLVAGIRSVSHDRARRAGRDAGAAGDRMREGAVPVWAAVGGRTGRLKDHGWC